MGWSDMDNGSEVAPNTLTLAPCFQTGVLASSVTTESPTDFCGTASDAAAAPTNTTVGAGTSVTWSSTDNRAAQPGDTQFPNAAGGLVTLTVPAGEPGSTSVQGSFIPPFNPTGFPMCTADLSAQNVTCTGLNDGNVYTITDGGQTVSGLTSADGVFSASLNLHRNDAVRLSNGLRTLTTLHVANLQVSIDGSSTSAQGSTVASGTCSSGQYWGGPLVGPVQSGEAGEFGFGGPAGTGEICTGGDPTGLPTSTIAQTDDQSGGETMVDLPDVADTSPLPGETVFGGFTALAESSGATLPIAVSIAPAAGGSAVFTSANTDTLNGVAVPALKPGPYVATWTLRDPNGDTRVIATRFIEQPGLQGQQVLQGSAGPQGAAGPQGTAGPQGQRGPQGPRGPAATVPRFKVTCKPAKHHKITCTVRFLAAKNIKGTLRMRVARGRHLVALGHARVRHSRAKVTMHALRRVKRGRLTVTIVLSRPHKATATRKAVAHMK